MEFCKTQLWLVKSKFAKLSDKTVNTIKSMDYFSNWQDYTATPKIFH